MSSQIYAPTLTFNSQLEFIILSLQPRGPHRVIEVVHLVPGVVREKTWVGPLAIPRPLVLQLRRERALHHLNHVLAQHGEELEAVEITACRDVEALCGGVGRDDEVGAGGEGVPVALSVCLSVYSGKCLRLTSRYGASPCSMTLRSCRRRRGWHMRCPPSACSIPSIVRSRARQEARMRNDLVPPLACF